MESSADHFTARLRVPERFGLPGGPAEGIGLAASIVHGFGRGSREMGVPTANLDVPQVEAALAGRPHGVYFGFARVLGAPGADGEVHPMVLNLGQRPTFADGDGLSVEAHLLHTFGADFYGREVRALVLGFLRPELLAQAREVHELAPKKSLVSHLIELGALSPGKLLALSGQVQPDLGEGTRVTASAPLSLPGLQHCLAAQECVDAVRENRYVVLPKDLDAAYKKHVNKASTDFAFYTA